MEIIVKVTDAELAEMGIAEDNLRELVINSLYDNPEYEESVDLNIEVINTSRSDYTEDKYLSIMNKKYEG